MTTTGNVRNVAAAQAEPSTPNRRHPIQATRRRDTNVDAAAGRRAIISLSPPSWNRAVCTQCSIGGLTSRGSPSNVGTT
jgi:hypothetical protein